MHIGIDISQAIYPGGVAVYLQNWLTALLNFDQTNHYQLFFSSWRQSPPQWAKTLARQPQVTLKRTHLPLRFLELLWNRWHYGDVEWFNGPLDIFHTSDWTQPPAGKAHLVTTIHDLSFLRWPTTVPASVLQTQRRRLAWVKKEKVAIIAVSKATKKEIINLLAIPGERIRVIYEALPADVTIFLRWRRKEKAKRLGETLRKKLGIKKPYFFAYGSLSARKNISRLLAAFTESNILRRNYQLLVVGNYHPPETQRTPGVIFTGYLPRREMLLLFARALALVYPSLYEGFGLPILEAFALGVPVLTSNCSSMAEIAAKAAVLVNPHEKDEIAQGMQILAREQQRRAFLRRRGRQRLKKFSWEKAARETVTFYQQLIGWGK